MRRTTTSYWQLNAADLNTELPLQPSCFTVRALGTFAPPRACNWLVTAFWAPVAFRTLRLIARGAAVVSFPWGSSAQLHDVWSGRVVDPESRRVFFLRNVLNGLDVATIPQASADANCMNRMLSVNSQHKQFHSEHKRAWMPSTNSVLARYLKLIPLK